MRTFDEVDRTNALIQEKIAQFQGLPPERMAAMVRQRSADMVKKLRADPIMLWFLRRPQMADEDGSPPVRTVREVMGEQKTTAYGLLAVPERQAAFRFREGSATDLPLPPGISESLVVEATAVDFAHRILNATPVLWPDEMRMTAIASPMPRHVTSRDMLPLPLMWFTFETGLHHSSSGMLIDSMLIEHSVDGFIVTNFGNQNGRYIVHSGFTPYGQTYPDDCPEAGPFLSMLSFMNSPYISTDTVPLTRPERREVQRNHRDYQFPDVKVIRLRSPLPKVKEQPGPDTTKSGHEYTHRWLVRGHHRAQWYPSTESHKVIWVAPYIKGPGDAPFVPPVYAVTR